MLNKKYGDPNITITTLTELVIFSVSVIIIITVSVNAFGDQA